MMLWTNLPPGLRASLLAELACRREARRAALSRWLSAPLRWLRGAAQKSPLSNPPSSLGAAS